MRLNNNTLEYSITDIVRYFRSPYASWATWANLIEPGTVFVENDMIQNSSLLLRSQENEEDAKRYLINNFDTVKTISNPLNSEEESRKLIESKFDVIVQPTIKRDSFVGRADFLIFNKKTGLYEVMDAKLAKQIKSEFLLQVCGYAWMLEEYQDNVSKYGWFFLGDESVEKFKIHEFYRFFLELKNEFIQAVDNYSLDEFPNPRKWEVFEEYSDAANLYWKKNNSLELIADISSRQIDILERNGYSSMKDVSNIQESSLTKLPSKSLDKLKRQANAQVLSDDDFTHIELRNGDESIYFLHSLLPPENNGDIYFDLEGYPFYDIRSEYTMEYLYGVAYKNDNGEMIFKDDLWADNEFEEKEIFNKFVNWVEERIKNYPNLKIYHYAHYEKTSLLKSAQKFGIHEIEIDNWIREGRLVDLFKVVKKAFIVGKDSYSLKRIEEIAGYKRELDLNSGIDSIYYFEKYLATKDEKIKNEILMYNKDDCIATKVVCDWLREMQSEYKYNFVYSEQERGQPSEKDIEINKIEEKINSIDSEIVDRQIKNFISTMPGYYRREEKVDWQEYFELLNMPIEEKINTPTAFGLLSLIKQPELADKKYILAYECSDGSFKKIKQGANVVLNFSYGELYEVYSLYPEVKSVSYNPFVIEFEISQKQWDKFKEVASEHALNMDNPVGFVNPVARETVWSSPYKSLVSTCYDFIENNHIPPLILKLLLNESNRLITDFDNEKNIVEKIYNITSNLNNSYLAIQGPPGTGKSTTLGEVISRLYKDGHRVGIVGPSYKATLNLVKKITPHLDPDVDVNFRGGGQEIKLEIESLDNVKSISTLNKDDSGLIATYVNSICNESYLDYFDYIVIDEVGQVPLVTTIATTQSTKNLILVGDPNQLPQVRNGSHPNNNGLSTLEFLIGEDTTLPVDKGLFLDTTYRMHPDVNNFISKYFYDDKLKPHSVTKTRTLNITSDLFKDSGIQFISVNHIGNTQESQEEVQVVYQLVNELIGKTIIENKTERFIKEKDILIVSPYNLQVFELSKKLGDNYRIGTVDKFQGQEAPIVIVSLAASNYEEAPRGIDFILNFNRMNVALSRSQCLSIVIGSPSLTHLHYQSLNSIRLTNFHRTLMNPS